MEGIIQAQAMAARIAFRRMTISHLTELHDSVERACGLESGSQWYREAAAHAEIFSLLADMVDDLVLTGGTAYVRDVMLAVGDGMIVSSRLRLVAHLRAGDGGGAALEMERRLRALLYMWRIAPPGSRAIAGEVVA